MGIGRSTWRTLSRILAPDASDSPSTHVRLANPGFIPFPQSERTPEETFRMFDPAELRRGFETAKKQMREDRQEHDAEGRPYGRHARRDEDSVIAEPNDPIEETS